jgi:hypothetical protein
MRALTATVLLDVWERGQIQLPGERAIALLVAGGVSSVEAEAYPLGQRDRLLVALRERLFGSRLVALAECSGCGEALEADFDSTAVRALALGTPGATPCPVNSHGYQVDFRLPTTADVLAATSASTDERQAAAVLLDRCVNRAEHDGVAVAPSQLPDGCRADVAAAMAALDPEAEIDVALSCPGCGQTSRAAFDITTFLWQEIGAWAGRTLAEVHTLAAAYGWPEANILGLSPWRRQRYLELVTA